MIKDIIFDLSNAANMKASYYIGQTLQIDDNTVTVRKVISKRYLTVSYGFDSKGNDVLGVIRVD